MKETKEMQAGCYYLFKGGSTARDLFFEEDQDIKDFKELFERILRGYVEVNKMLLYKDQWAIAVRLKSKEEIINQYKFDRDKSKKADRAKDLKEPWRIVSERIRIFLCNYVVNTNGRKGRKGGKVDMSYKRYYFTSLEEMNCELTKWEKREISSRQESDQYQFLSKYYKVNEKNDGIKMLIYCSKEKVNAFIECHTHEIWNIMSESNDVVGTWIEKTKMLHSPPI